VSDDLKRLLAEQQREVARLRGMLELDGRELVRIEFTETRQRRQLVLTMAAAESEDVEREAALRFVAAVQALAPVEFGLTEAQQAAVDDADRWLCDHGGEALAHALREAFELSE
jgi:hypothetical protein